MTILNARMMFLKINQPMAMSPPLCDGMWSARNAGISHTINEHACTLDPFSQFGAEKT